MSPRQQPPRISENLLRAALPLRDRDAIIGDIAEEFRAMVEQRGVRRARSWYHRQIAQSLVPALKRRITERRRIRTIDMRRSGLLTSIRPDVAHVFRIARRKPGFIAVVLLTAALGIGSLTAVFTIVHGVLLRPLPYEEPDRLYTLWERTRSGGMGWVSAPNFQDWREELTSFSAVGAFTPEGFNVAAQGTPERIEAQSVTPEFFDVLHADFALGRGFLAEDVRTSSTAVAVISYGLWQRQFGGSQDVIGASLLLESEPYVIVGVLQQGTDFPLGVDLWVPVDLVSAGWKRQRGTSWLKVIGRLAPGVTLESAREEMTNLGGALAQTYPDTNRGENIVAVSLLDELVGDTRTPLLILAGAVTVMMLVVCVNIAALFLAQSGHRQRELALRRSLGANRRRLVRQLLTESVVISAVGGLLGSIVALVELRVLSGLAPRDLPRLPDTGVTVTMLVIAGAATLAAGVLSGLVPAIRQAQVAPSSALATDAGAAKPLALRNMLVIAEVALAVVLVVAAGHLLQSLRNYRAVDPGFRPQGVLSGALPLDETRYPTDERVASFYDELIRRVRAVPGVDEAGVVSVLPLSGNTVTFSFELRDPGRFESDQLRARYQSASAGYFRAMGIPVLQGRAFRDGEGLTDEPVVIIDEVFAERFFPGMNPLNQEVGAIDDAWRRVVGVVGAVRGSGLSQDPDPMFYVPLNQDPRDAMTLVVRRETMDAFSLVSPIRNVIRDLDATQPFVSPIPMTDLVDRALAGPRFIASVVGFFGVITLFLAALGLYGLLSHVVATRTREIAIRVALGATTRVVRSLVVRRGMILTTIGLGLGLGAAIPAVRLARGALFGVSPFEPVIAVSVGVLLFAVGIIASYLPVRRATRLDPAIALRVE